MDRKKLCIWLLKDGEALPVVPGAKKMRTWRLGEELAARGHHVTWWASTFAHLQKKKVADRDIDYEISPNFILKMLEAGSYKRNLSFKRIWQHARLGRRFYEKAASMPKPDLIVCSYPTIDLAYQSTRFGKEHNIPVILDIRDMWPATFEDYFSSLLKVFVRIGCYPLKFKGRKAIQSAACIVGSSQDMLEFGKVMGGKILPFQSLFYLSSADKGENTLITEPKILELQSYVSDRFVIGFLGTFGSTYDLETVCEAAQIFQETNPKIYFFLAGDGEQNNTLKHRFGHLKNLRFLGWLDEKESKDFLKMLHIGLIPVKGLAVPNKFFDYLAYGVPVLSSVLGEGKLLIERLNFGLSYDHNNTQSLVEAIQAVLDVDVYNHLKLKAKLSFSIFDPQKTYKEMADFLEITSSKEKNFF